MTFTVLVLLFIIIYTYAGYPISLFIFSILFPAKKLKVEMLPTVGLLIAAYNEEDNIESKITNSLQLDYPKDRLEIIVVSDGSTDRTDEIVKRYADLGVKLYRVEGRVGKTEARNQAVLANSNEIIVFSDATAEYEKNAIKELVSNFADDKVGMVSGNLIYRDSNNSSMGIATKLYWKYELLIKNSQARLKTLTGAIGCINAFRRELYTVLPQNIIEDFTEPLTIITKGYNIAYEQNAIAYERTTQKSSQEFNMRVRVIRGGMTGLLYAKRILNPFNFPHASFQLIGHKVLRWIMPLFLIFLLLITSLGVIFANSSLLSILMVMQLIFYAVGTAGLVLNLKGVLKKITLLPAYFIIVNLASLKALYLTVTTELEATWETNVY